MQYIIIYHYAKQVEINVIAYILPVMAAILDLPVSPTSEAEYIHASPTVLLKPKIVGFEHTQYLSV